MPEKTEAQRQENKCQHQYRQPCVHGKSQLGSNDTTGPEIPPEFIQGKQHHSQHGKHAQRQEKTVRFVSFYLLFIIHSSKIYYI
ncbi:hypothetical protein FQZ97_1106580 [compost metagenome]